MPDILIKDLGEPDSEECKIALRLSLSMYLGETFPYCHKKFEEMDDLKDAVWNGYTEFGRIAHKTCFMQVHLDWKPESEEHPGYCPNCGAPEVWCTCQERNKNESI